MIKCLECDVEVERANRGRFLAYHCPECEREIRPNGTPVVISRQSTINKQRVLDLIAEQYQDLKKDMT